MTPIWLAFLSGLTTGGISCLAVQGGLLASAVASARESNRGDQGDRGNTGGKGAGEWRYVAVFLLAKLFGYTLLGFVLGWVGSLFMLSPIVLGWVQIVVGLFMLATAANILKLHPIFRYAVIQPPMGVYKFLRKRSRDPSLLAPGVVGFLTILMPCGVTQATMALAVASGSPAMGAAIMFAFVLGTSPIFFALGATVTELMKRPVFSYVAGGVVALFAVLSINGGVGLMGSPYTLQNFYRVATTDAGALGGGQVAGLNSDGEQEATITVTGRGYETSVSTLKAGVPVRLTLASVNVRGCTRGFTIPSLNISKILPENGEEVVEFTPTKTGKLAFSCSMGMYTGQFTVVN